MPVEAQQVIIGTAGHIDHGKTALVKALTGIDADTLAEEKKRGITIELGFVFLDTPGYDRQIVFIDVPGHEKLIRTMVAGASNISAVMLVVAADEGIAAQTTEHFDILQLLGIHTGIIALTKADLVDDEWAQDVISDVRNYVAGTFLRNAPIIPVSSITGEGVDEIRSALMSVADTVQSRPDSGIFRMPVDRAFTMHGFGTVIAGTVLSGQVSVGDRIEILPDGISAKVRGIQVHNQSVEASHIGVRTALNLQDVKKDQLRRGQCAGAPESLSPTSRLDARLHLLQSYPDALKNGARVRLHLGTDEVMSRLVLLDRDKLGPGQAAPVQFVLEAPTVARHNDRFVVRTFSPMVTIGGGTVLDAEPAHHKRLDPEMLEALDRLQGTLADVAEQTFHGSLFLPQSPAQVALSIGRHEDEVTEAAEHLAAAGALVKVSAGAAHDDPRARTQVRYIHSEHYDALAHMLTDGVQAYFEKNPYRLLMPATNVQSEILKVADRQLVESVVARLCEKEIIHQEENGIGLVGRDMGLKPEEVAAAQRIEAIFRNAGLAPPLERDVNEQARITPEAFRGVMTLLIEQKRLVRLSDKVTYHVDHLQRARDAVTAHIQSSGAITAGELRDKLGVSRKYAIALLEHFDDVRVTRREGDKRVLA